LSEYEQVISKDIDRIANYLDDFMKNNNISPENIDTIFLTGGTSQVSSIQRLFRERFPQVNLNSGDNFRSVAKGLAYSGYLFEGN